ncbi:MAG: UDP-N-acetylglucosamine 2-epimerase (non-hydrolyzing) [Burkholderiales bacterium]|nr:UDP-N-acetylglucosamine 2-epimerase (non-hydrolyzing) [Burkholderiales bacterium]
MKLSLVAGARPNFMKVAPLIRAIRARDDRFEYRLVHTGQHYDREMSDVFFEELGIPAPHDHLGAGGGSHAEQTAKILVGYEQACLERRPDAVIVVGDVNSTLACSITAKKLQIPVAHVEAGLRSGDRAMPEEINRLVTDAISDHLFVTEAAARDNLLREGHAPDSIHFVGHVMVDNLLYQRERLRHWDPSQLPSARLKSTHERYGVVTLHRPSNVDSGPTLRGIVEALNQVAARLPLLFAVHPRTRAAMERFGIALDPGVVLLPPLAYMDFLNLWKDAALVMTDSGGLQEETTALGVPCLTLRTNTERPITVDVGTNRVVGVDPQAIVAAAASILDGRAKVGRIPELWDGRAAERIVQILEQVLA